MKIPAFVLAAVPFAVCPAWSAPHRYDHVVVVVEENRTPTQIVGDTTNAPYITSLANGGVSIGRMFAIEHPSQPNYLQLFSGSNQGVLDDELPPNFSTTPTSTYPFTTGNLGAEIVAAGFSFAGYSDQLESAGAADWADYDPHSATNPGVYYRRKHNPWANWVAKVAPQPANQLPAAVNRAFTQFPTDFTQLPTLSFVVPNQLHDMHDGSRKEGDTWLRDNLDAYAQWARTHNSLLVVTWDEDDYNATNQIPTVFYGAALRNGTVAPGTWTLHNLLRTFEDMYGSAAHAGSAAQVRPMVGAFSDDPAVVVATFRAGLNGYSAVQDTMLAQNDPTANNAATHDLNVDKDLSSATGDQVGQALVRFDALFGSAAGQIPSGATIHSAKLILSTPANGTGTDYDSNDTMRAHRMIVDWADTATWDSLVGGVSTDGVEAVAASSFSLVPDVDGGPAIFDVTADIEAFKAGTAQNRGWLLRASSTGTGDGWTMKSSETASDVTLRPTLEIVYSLSATPYQTWAAAKGLTAGNSDGALDPDRDGATNAVEFAFNLNPLVPDARETTAGGTTGLPYGQLVTVSGQPRLELVFLRRKAAAAAGLTYTPQFSGDLDNWTDGGSVTTTTSIDADWERVTIRDTATAQRLRFGRVKVTL